MPYDERSINELYESAEITPMGIQLEVNAEIFTTIYNLLSNMRSEEGIQQEDEKRLLHLWRKTVRAMAKVELRKGHGISMEKQIEMLKEAYAIETKYTADQLFSSVSSSKLTKEELEEVRRFSAEEMNTLFNSVIWPAMIKGKTGAQENPTAFIIAGQPGSGKTRMSSVIIDDYDGDIIQSMSDNFRGFHSRAKEVFQKYGRYCTYFSTKEGKYLSDLAMRKAAEEKYHILQEGSLDDSAHTMALINVTIEYMSEATEVLAAMQASSGYPVAMLPQPYVTTAQMQMEGLKVALDMTEEWDKVSPDSALVTGVVVARKEFVEQNEAAFNEFLEDYKASTEFVNANVDEAAALVAGYEIVPKEPIAQKALPECNITFISGADMKAKVSGYLKVLYDQNPEAVGGTLPDDAFYYGA